MSHRSSTRRRTRTASSVQTAGRLNEPRHREGVQKTPRVSMTLPEHAPQAHGSQSTSGNSSHTWARDKFSGQLTRGGHSSQVIRRTLCHEGFGLDFAAGSSPQSGRFFVMSQTNVCCVDLSQNSSRFTDVRGLSRHRGRQRRASSRPLRLPWFFTS